MQVSESANLAELGMDSLMGAEIKQTLERGYDVVLGVQEIRALTFGRLKVMAGVGSEGEGAGADTPRGPADLVQFAALGELMPKQTLVKLPSAQPPSAEAPPVFMVRALNTTSIAFF